MFFLNFIYFGADRGFLFDFFSWALEVAIGRTWHMSLPGSKVGWGGYHTLNSTSLGSLPSGMMVVILNAPVISLICFLLLEYT